MNIRDIFKKPADDRHAGHRNSGSPRRGIHLGLSAIALVAALCFVPAFFSSPAVMATSVNRLAICNLEGSPGETIDTEVTLESTDTGERTGHWTTHYKAVDGDSEKMDITSWISFEPSSEYTLAVGESKSFMVRIVIPDDAEPGLWGATSEEADISGHSDERRTYVIFKDADSVSGSLFSGLLIPVSVNVTGRPNAFTPMVNWIQANVMVSILIAVVIVLLSVMAAKRRKMKAES